MFWLAGRLLGLVLVVLGILLVIGVVVAGLFAAGLVICLALFAMALITDGLVSLFTWKWDRFAAVKWLDRAMQKG